MLPYKGKSSPVFLQSEGPKVGQLNQEEKILLLAALLWDLFYISTLTQG